MNLTCKGKKSVFSEEKLRGVLEYCLLHGSKHKGIPKTKLFKLIYLADFSQYFFTGKPITDQQYKNRPYGPVPDVLFALVEEMIDAGDVVVENGKKAQFHELIVRPQFIKLLSKEEKAILKKICDYWKEKSSVTIVNFVHDQRPWCLTREKEEVPYELILQEEHPFSPEKK